MRRIARRLRTCKRDISSRSTFTIPIFSVSTFTEYGALATTPTTIRNVGASSTDSAHYDDELAKTNGKWLFTMRKIYNEGRDEWAYKGGKNPAW